MTGIGHQVFEQRVLLGREFDPLSGPPHLSRQSVEFEIGDAELASTAYGAASEKRFDAYKQFGESEGLVR